MPESGHRVECSFNALSDPTRRAVVEALCKGPATVANLAAPFAMALPSFTRHPGVLEGAGPIVARGDGRNRVCALHPGALKDAQAWLAANRRGRDRRLARFAVRLENTRAGEIECV